MKEALTKIIATIGPASLEVAILKGIINSGADVLRLNLKHSNYTWHRRSLRKIKTVLKEIKKPVGILLDAPDEFKNFTLDFFQWADFVAISFTRKAKDIIFAKKRLPKETKIVAKIENIDGIKNFDEILEVSDGIMIGRGDLAKQIPFEKLPFYQKLLIRKSAEKGKPVIVATEMLKSMVENKFPTRAEISDVANAILDYADALMLSEETAIGKYPVLSVKTMEKICKFWEKKRKLPFHFNFEINSPTSAVAFSAWELWSKLAEHKIPISGFLVLTKTGTLASFLSRLKPQIPIFALTPKEKVKSQLSLYFGVIPYKFKEKIYKKRGPKEITKILNFAKRVCKIKPKKKIILIFSEEWKNTLPVLITRVQQIP